MTQTNNDIRKKDANAVRKSAAPKAGAVKSAAVKKPAAAKKQERDPYDEFLENAEKAEKAVRQRKPAAAKAEQSAAVGKSAPKPAGTKPAAKKPVSAPKKKKPEAAGDLLMPWEDLEKEAKPEKAAKPKKDVQREEKPDRARSQQKTTAAGRKPAQSKKTPAKKPAKKDKSRDAYDDFLDQTESVGPAEKKKSGFSGATAVLLVMIMCMLGLGGWQYTRYQTFLTMKAAVDRATFYEGITVEGVNVENMTLEQALEHWETGIEPGYSQRRVTLSNGAEFTAAELGYSSDYASVLTAAWSAGRSGSLAERYEALAFRKNQPASYNVNRKPYSTDVIAQCAAAVAGQIDRPAENAHIESFDTSSYKFKFTDEVVGSRLDQARLQQDIVAALDAGGGTVELIVNSIQPEVKQADIAGKYGMITSAVTNASSSSSNRLSNIKLATKTINGTCLKPGETFSFNGVVGERTTKRGYKTATAYSGGKVVEDVGGGICQVSTTLFNAAVKADLKIVERHNHSLTVGYVDKGKDAAVNWGSQDLRFTNNTDDNIYICGYVTDDKRVRFGIFGKLLPNGESITVEGVTTGEVPYETVMQPSMLLFSGETQVVQKGKVGYTAEAYKIRWDANGKQISRELLCKSTYRATSEIVEFGP